jgi:hypothetical protein
MIVDQGTCPEGSSHRAPPDGSCSVRSRLSGETPVVKHVYEGWFVGHWTADHQAVGSIADDRML